MGRRAGKIGTTLDYSTMYDQLKIELSGAPHDIKVEKLDKFYRRIVDTAKHILLEIERMSTKKWYEEVTQYAYKKALYDIRTLFGDDAKRFRAAKFPKNDLRNAPKYINSVLRFLEMPTSTKVGIQTVYQKRADTINQRYGTNISWGTVANLYQSNLYRKLDSKYGSKTAVRVIAQYQKNEKEIQKYFKDISNSKKKGKVPEDISIQVNDKHLEDTVNEVLKEYGTDISKLLKKIWLKKEEYDTKRTLWD